MIEKIIINSRTTEMNGSASLMNNAFQKSGLTDDAVLTKVFTPLNEKNAELGEAIDRSKADSVLAGKDGKRDNRIRAVGYLVLGYLYYPDEAVRQAAATVQQVFEKYGFAVIKESYITESSLINSMLGDFAAPKVQSALALLPGVSENIAALRAAETDFINTQTEYAQELAEDDSKVSATTLKKEVADIINNDLVVFLRTGERFQPDIYGKFARTIAEIINNNNEQVKKRRKKDES